MEELDYNEIIDPEELFSDSGSDSSTLQDIEVEEETESKETNNTIEEYIDGENPFDTPESVGSEENEDNKTIQEDTSPKSEGGSSQNFYSSITSALAEEGVFPDLDEEYINSVQSPEDFIRVINEEVSKRFDERQKRIDAALNYNVEPSIIQHLESSIQTLSSITEETLKDEGEDGVNIRKALIVQDLKNKGYSEERIQKELNKSLNAGTDIEDAFYAYNSLAEYYNNAYKDTIEEHKKAEEERVRSLQERAKQIHNHFYNKDSFMEELGVDKHTIDLAFNNYASPAFVDSTTGRKMTAMEKAATEDELGFIRGMSIAFTLTDGFKNLSRLANGTVKKQVKAKLKDLEGKLNTSVNFSNGNYSFVTSVKEDPESYVGSKVRLDI